MIMESFYKVNYIIFLIYPQPDAGNVLLVSFAISRKTVMNLIARTGMNA